MTIWRGPFLWCSCRERLQQSPGRPVLWWSRMLSWRLGLEELEGLISGDKDDKQTVREIWTIELQWFSPTFIFSSVWDTEVLPAMQTCLLTECLEIVVSPQLPPAGPTLTEQRKRENLPENFYNFLVHLWVCLLSSPVSPGRFSLYYTNSEVWGGVPLYRLCERCLRLLSNIFTLIFTLIHPAARNIIILRLQSVIGKNINSLFINHIFALNLL